MGAYFPMPLEDKDLVFVSLGMVVLDEIRFPNGPALYNVAGGSGLYSMCVSARDGSRFAYSVQAHSARA